MVVNLVASKHDSMRGPILSVSDSVSSVSHECTQQHTENSCHNFFKFLAKHSTLKKLPMVIIAGISSHGNAPVCSHKAPVPVVVVGIEGPDIKVYARARRGTYGCGVWRYREDTHRDVRENRRDFKGIRTWFTG